jgi:hypothetical protein
MVQVVIRRLQNINNWTVFYILVFVTLATSIASAIVNIEGADSLWWSGLLQNFSTEMMGAIATFGLFELVVGVRNEKQKLIIQMRSNNKADVNNAVEQLRAEGWLEDGSLKKANLREVNLESERLMNANLEGTYLNRANLQDAEINEANLEGAKLWGRNLQNVSLWLTNLKGANLAGSNLQGAKLGGANLQGAWLNDVILRGVHLREANLEGARLKNAKFDEKTVLPDAEIINNDAFNPTFDKYWTPDTDMRRYTDPNHVDENGNPDFYKPWWATEQEE